MNINSELFPVFVTIVIGLTFLAFILLRFTGQYSVYIMLGVCLILAIIIGFFSSILNNWGKNHSSLDFLVHSFILFIVPCLLAALIHYGLINNLKKYGLLNITTGSIALVLIYLIFKYTIHYKKYIWTTAIDKDEYTELVRSSIYGIDNIRTFGTIFQVTKNSYYDLNRKRDNHYTILYKGTPYYLSLIYYSQKEHVFYQGDFNISKKKITEAMGNGLLFPLTGKQNYEQINLIIKDKGTIQLEFSKGLKTFTVFEGICTPIKKSELPEYESQLLIEKEIEEKYNARELELNP